MFPKGLFLAHPEYSKMLLIINALQIGLQAYTKDSK